MADDAPLDDALAIARSGSRVPLVFFQSSTHAGNRSEFSLVVPLLAHPRAWLAELAELIERGRVQQAPSQQVSRQVQALRIQNPTSNGRSTAPPHTDPSPQPVRRPNTPTPGLLAFNWEHVSLQNQRPGQFLKSLTSEMVHDLESIMTVSFC